MENYRSHTNPLANLVVLSGLDIKRHFNDILQRDFPISTLPTFLHEATHYYCFDSPVGLALHLLFLRARRLAWIQFQQQGSKDQAWEVINSVIRYETVLSVLRPVSEGLALFAEHDVVPGHTRIISNPMRLVATVYGRGVAVLGEKPLEDMPLLLSAGRLSRNNVRSKADLLVQPMTCDRGGYLPGYLLIKALWAESCLHSDMFLDTDFFLQYLSNHIYRDWKLVSILLDESTKDIGALDHIEGRIVERLNEFLQTAVHGERPKIFEEIMEKGDMRQLEVKTKLVETTVSYMPYEEDADAELGRARLQQLMHDLFKEQPEDESIRALVENDIRDMGLRTILNIGHVTLEAKSGPQGFELHSEDELLARMPADLVAEEERKSGSVDVDIIGIQLTGRLFATLTRQSTVLCILPLGNYETPPFLNLLMVNLQRRRSFTELSQDLVQEALETDNLNEILDSTLEDIHEAINKSYLPAVFSNVKDVDIQRVMKETEKDGLLSVLDDDLRLVLDAAAVSLCDPLPYNYNAVDSFHSWSTDSPESSIARINNLMNERLGFYAFVRRGERELSMI